MRVQITGIVRVLGVLVAAALLAPVSVDAQPSSSSSSSSPSSSSSASSSSSSVAASVPRMPDGRPDLQGVWDFASVTPLRRPAEMAGKEFLTDEDVAALEAQAAGRVDQPPPPGDPGGYNRFWFADGTKVVSTNRTSLIVDPPDGQLPAYEPDGQARMALRAEARLRNAGPEDRDIDERCILGFNTGPPMLPGAYNNLFQLFQTPGHVVLFNEMVNDARMVPLDGRPPLPSDIQQWRGDSRGRWDGDTLVVETRNFRDIGTAHPSPNIEVLEALGPDLHLVERFSYFDADTLLYEFTVNDPTAFARPWSGEMTMTRVDTVLYEYACHEGNYGLTNILAGAQAEHRAANSK